MCNPPFFSDIEDTGKNEKTVCTGTSNELVTEGGEFAFISPMISDSLILKQQIRWYTSLVGRKVNIKLLISELRKHNIVNYRTTTFSQGRTTRWAIAWSFSADGLREMVKSKVAAQTTRLEQNTKFTVKCASPSKVVYLLEQLFTELGVKYKCDKMTYYFKGEAFFESWKTKKDDQSALQPLFSFEIQLLRQSPQEYCVDGKFKGGANSKASFLEFFGFLKDKILKQ